MLRARSLLSAALMASMASLTGCSGDGSAASGGAAVGASATPAARTSADVLAVVQAAGGKATGGGTSRISLDSTTKVGPQSVTLKGQGAFDYGTDEGQFDIDLGTAGRAGGGTVAERIVDGSLYLSLPGRGGVFYKLDVDALAGTSLGSSTDPASAFTALQGAGDDIVEVGREQVRGAATTHYRGTVDVKKAIAASTGAAKKQLETTLGRSGDATVPFDVFIDDEGRLRRYTQELQIDGGPQAGGQPVASRTTIEVYDFGVPVDVTAPPAAQVQDGKPLLDALKAGRR